MFGSAHMNEQLPERRACIVEGAYALALLYTLGYLLMMGALMFVNIPENNRELLLTLAGIMSAAQLGIIKHYYDGSRIAETAQIANIGRARTADAVIQDIAKTGTPTTDAVIVTGGVRSAPSASSPNKPSRRAR